MSKNNYKNYFKKSSIVPLSIILLFTGVVLYFAASTFLDSGTASATDSTNRLDLKGPQKKQGLNKQYLFPLKGADGQEVSKLAFTIEEAEVREEIVIKGQKATAIEGRAFLILNLKITNDYESAIQINARDYVRLQVGNSKEKLAPDIHNDPVEIQAISTKYTRVGFPIDENAGNLTLIVGEISGDKQNLKLNLK